MTGPIGAVRVLMKAAVVASFLAFEVQVCLPLPPSLEARSNELQ